MKPPMTVLMTDVFRKKHHFHPNHFDLLAATSSWSCFVNHNLTHHADAALTNSMPTIEVEAEAVFHLRGLPSNLTTAGVTAYTHGQCDPFKVGRQVSSTDATGATYNSSNKSHATDQAESAGARQLRAGGQVACKRGRGKSRGRRPHCAARLVLGAGR